MNCKICNKTFTGIKNLKDHERSRKHLNKVDLHRKLFAPQKAEVSSDNTSLFFCSICNLNFNTLLDYQNHAQSTEHAAVVTIVKRGHLYNNEIPPKYIAAEITPLNPDDVKCDVCIKRFSGLKPYEQHLESGSHKKKCASLQYIQNGHDDNQSDSYFCEICSKQCNGPVTYFQHLESSAHKNKKCLQVGLEVKELVVEKDAFYCKVCQKQCSGYAPFSQHISGKLHLKKLKKINIKPGNETSNESIDKEKTVNQISPSSTHLGEESPTLLESELNETKQKIASSETPYLEESNVKEQLKQELPKELANGNLNAKEYSPTEINVYKLNKEKEQRSTCETFLQQEHLPQVKEPSELMCKKRKETFEETPLFESSCLSLPTDFDSSYCEFASTKTAGEMLSENGIEPLNKKLKVSISDFDNADSLP